MVSVLGERKRRFMLVSVGMIGALSRGVRVCIEKRVGGRGAWLRGMLRSGINDDRVAGGIGLGICWSFYCYLGLGFMRSFVI